MDNTQLDNARKLSRAISLKVERQAKTLEASKGELAAIEDYIQDLQNSYHPPTAPSKGK